MEFSWPDITFHCLTRGVRVLRFHRIRKNVIVPHKMCIDVVRMLCACQKPNNDDGTRTNIQTARRVARGIGSWSAGVTAPSKTDPRESRRENSVVAPTPPCHVRPPAELGRPAATAILSAMSANFEKNCISRTDASPKTKYGFLESSFDHTGFRAHNIVFHDVVICNGKQFFNSNFDISNSLVNFFSHILTSCLNFRCVSSICFVCCLSSIHTSWTLSCGI